MSIDRPDIMPARRTVPRRISRTGETLQLIRTTGASTIADVAEQMDVARSTATERVERLLAHELVRVVEAPVQGRGRPATMFEFNPAAGSILTAHVGMTGMRLGVTDLAAELIDHRMQDLDIAAGPEMLCRQLIEAFEALLCETDTPRPPIHGLGIGLPGRIELAGIAGVGPDWPTFPLAPQLAAHFGSPCLVDRDVNLLALGEQGSSHASKGVHLCVKVGSAIGCGIAIDGHVVHGADGLAGEIGHTKVLGRNDPCRCGNRGCLSAVASGAALVEQVASAGFDVHHVRDVAALANAGVPEATEAIRQAGRHIGQVLAGCVNLLNPMTISLWGYLLDAEEPLIAGIRESLVALAAPASTRDLSIVSTQDGDVTGLRGAALMVTEHVLSPSAIDHLMDAAVDRSADTPD